MTTQLNIVEAAHAKAAQEAEEFYKGTYDEAARKAAHREAHEAAQELAHGAASDGSLTLIGPEGCDFV